MKVESESHFQVPAFAVPDDGGVVTVGVTGFYLTFCFFSQMPPFSAEVRMCGGDCNVV